MRVIVCGINYAPEMIGIGPCNTALCEWLKAQGHDVVMVTAFPYYPSWKKREEDRGRWSSKEMVNGVEVHRCWHYVPEHPTVVKRMLHEASFVKTSFLKQMMLPRADVYMVVSPPLVLGVSAWLVSLMKRAPFVFHVQDLQPDAAVALGLLKPGWLTKILYGLESFAYRSAARVSGISEAMTDAYVAKGIARSKTICFPNSTVIPPLESLPGRGHFRKRHGIRDDEFVALYSGNLGEKQGLDVLDAVARILKSERIRIVICGDGARRLKLEDEMLKQGLKNLLLLPLQPRREYEEMLVDADACMITQQPGSGACFFPSKLLTTLAFGRAVVAVADEESVLSRAVREGGFGVVVPPRDSAALVAKLEELAASPAQVEEMGRVGRRYVERFEAVQVMPPFEAALKELSGVD
ncbi:colanic acid biosynthesis glycosyltransferase WcaI [Phragmitibacter flavus]|uniref:Colanic acid biosynthesis glycosyltransferase WcaI n=1 Tax=Phragmitibacter flavus TaxID=2576071 RepID=A0A5R8K7U7_9BACT|nr:WcaI family glycosyltransferase [Phragmitibacter flavus]TLD68411.1 colanic acid biosynthesis glycosyltransferase WcaI [Phragmitibacter flavus]